MRHWGEMREVLRNGNTEGRIALSEILGPNTIAVGALEHLEAEITVLDGVAHLAEVSDGGARVRDVDPLDQATLLVAADVAEWSEHELGPVDDLSSLEERVRVAASELGFGPEPFPFRVEGTADRVQLHVLDHSCPVANPEGPPPWRFEGENEPVLLAGFHAEGAAGVLTHHGQSTHTHVILPQRGRSGHLDAVSFADGARLSLPVR